MVGICFSVLVIMGLANICGEIVMRISLTKREPARNKLAWWRYGGDEVVETYEQLFPRSLLPLLRRVTFWSFVAFSGVVLLVMLMSKSR